MKTLDISIDGWQIFSPLGATSEEAWTSYTSGKSFFQKICSRGKIYPIAPLHPSAQEKVNALDVYPEYGQLDPSVRYAIATTRELMKDVHWSIDDNVGLNLGSSRGTTHTIEKYHSDYLSDNRLSPLSSPLTTAGNLSSWVARDIGIQGFNLSHSITCSSALHAIINAVAWLKSGMHSHFLAGASEACLTPFTLAQMKQLKVISSDTSDFPCRALDLNKKKNTMVLGDAAGLLALSTTSDSPFRITGVGFALEKISHATSISENGEGFYKAMQMAIGNSSPEDIDLVIMHSPGTLLGDRAEFNAIQRIFSSELPYLFSSKYFAGHSLGASGILGIEAALLMMKRKEYLPIPTFPQISRKSPPRNALINAMGFGGNAACIRISYIL